MSGDRDACLRAGMDAYLTKPIDVAALFAMIGELAGAGGSFDEQTLLENFGGDAALLKRLVPVFVAESERLAGQLASAIAASDERAIEVLAHSLESAIGHWTTGRAYEAARDLEAHARAGRSDEAAAAWSVLRDELPRLRESVGRFTAEDAPVG